MKLSFLVIVLCVLTENMVIGLLGTTIRNFSIYGIAGTPSDLLLLLLQNRRDLHMCVSCHKSIFFQGKSILSGFYVPVIAVTGRNTRFANTMSMKVPKTRTKMGQNAISYRGPKFWNSLPCELHMVENFTSFQRLISLRIVNLFENHPT